MNLRDFLRERVAGGGPPATMPNGASFAYVFGTVLMFLLGVEAVTGVALAAFYSPSSTDAWASVAYIQDRTTWGWLVRGLHHHGGSAIVIVSGIHLLQTAVSGAYKKPRELVWWLGVVLLGLVLAWSITGFWLRWDQAAYWASQIELGIASETPVVGDTLRQLAIGGNDHGNLTLTRSYAIHVIVLPAVVAAITVLHIGLARRFGPTPLRREAPAVARWPHQSVRDVIALAIVFAVLLAVVVARHGVSLGAPADPTQPFDARPLWPFRWLYELRVLAGSAELLAAMVAPAILGGFLIALPLLDRSATRAPRKRMAWLGGLAGVFAVVGALTVASFARDANDEGLAKRRASADQRATRARELAAAYGVPVTGPRDVFLAAPMARARQLFAQRCANCHAADSPKRKGPVLGPGHGNRAWLTRFLHAPSADEMWGRTKLAKSEAAMMAVDLPADDLGDLVELIYAESGATDVDAAKLARGKLAFEACTDCHSLVEGEGGGSGPGLAGHGSQAYYRSFISNPKSALHMGTDKSQMPRFDDDLTLAELDELAGYMVWLRTATAEDLARLGPPPP